MNGNSGWSRGYEKESPAEPAEEPPDGHCPKCEHEEVDISTISMKEGTAQRLLDVDGSAFNAVSCAHCGYTEFYRGRGRRNALRHFFVTDE